MGLTLLQTILDSSFTGVQKLSVCIGGSATASRGSRTRRWWKLCHSEEKTTSKPYHVHKTTATGIGESFREKALSWYRSEGRTRREDQHQRGTNSGKTKQKLCSRTLYVKLESVKFVAVSSFFILIECREEISNPIFKNRDVTKN